MTLLFFQTILLFANNKAVYLLPRLVPFTYLFIYRGSYVYLLKKTTNNDGLSYKTKALDSLSTIFHKLSYEIKLGVISECSESKALMLYSYFNKPGPLL